MTADLDRLVAELAGRLNARAACMATVESCTGGGIAWLLTSLAGSSNWFGGGLVTYTNRSKRELAAVSADLLDRYGAVSEPVARAMAGGGLAALHADYAVAVTGIAGPDGGTRTKPVGTVCIAWAGTDGLDDATTCRFGGDRAQVRDAAIHAAVEGMLDRLE